MRVKAFQTKGNTMDKGIGAENSGLCLSGADEWKGHSPHPSLWRDYAGDFPAGWSQGWIVS